jgi:hypothetical protein
VKLSLGDYAKKDEMGEACSKHGPREMYIKQFERKISMEGKGAWVEEECYLTEILFEGASCIELIQHRAQMVGFC